MQIRQPNPVTMELSFSFTQMLVIWLMFINLAAVLSFRIDKARSLSGGWRIREQTLLSIAFWGGSLGALLAQQRFRHKTMKEPFRSNLIKIAVFHVMIGLAFAFPPIREMILATLQANLPWLR